jgi:hypothetical protein
LNLTVEAILAFLSFIIVCLTLLVYRRQAKTMERQASLASKQLELTDAQRAISDNQLQLSARPNLRIDTLVGDADVALQEIQLSNHGIADVVNLRIEFLYFAKIEGHGWWVNAPSGGPCRERLSPQQKWNANVGSFGTFGRHAHPHEYEVQGNLELGVFVIAFERSVDGHGYVALLPTTIIDEKVLPFGSSRDIAGTGGSGPLDHMTSPAIELALEFLRRKPLPRAYELYNYTYLLGYSPSGALGDLRWTR